MRAPLALRIAVASVVALVAFFGGRALHSQTSTESAFDFNSPAYQGAPAVAGFSKGGFSGFGEISGFEGRTVVAGKIVSADAAAIVVESAAGVRSTVRLEGAEPLQIIRPGSRADLGITMSVAIITAQDSDEAAAILVLPQY